MPNLRPPSLLWPALAGLLFIGLWYGIRLGLSAEQQFLLPAPDEIIRAFGEQRTALWQATINTTKGALLGFGAAIATSFGFALLLSLSPLVRSSLYPYLMILQMTPIIVLAPIIILWSGAGLRSVAIITFLICFFPMVVNTTQGLISTDRHLVDLFRMYRASKRQEILLLRVPAALPYFFTGLRIAATLAPIGAIVGDFYAGNSSGGHAGLGFLTLIYTSQLRIPALFATAATSCLLGFVFVITVIALSWWSLRHWHDSFRHRDT